MKKAFILLLAVVSMFAFAGCAAGYDSTTGYDGYGYDGYYNNYNTRYNNGYNRTNNGYNNNGYNRTNNNGTNNNGTNNNTGYGMDYNRTNY